jgi:hypothetical protein
MEYKHFCTEENAARFAEWMQTRGGLAVWNTLMIGSETSWTTPLLDKDGKPTTKPHSYAETTPHLVVTDPADVCVESLVEYKRFHVALRRGSQGLTIKLTDGSNAKLNRALAQAGIGSTYYFDYENQEAVVLKPDPTRSRSLADWIAEQVKV